MSKPMTTKENREEILRALTRVIVGVTKNSVSDCMWYEGIEYDGIEELLDALRRSHER